MPEPLVFSAAEKAAFRSEYAASATDLQFEFFINECQRRALVPGVHVIFNLRSTTEYSHTMKSNVTVQKVAFLTTIYALRLIAQRDGNYEGHGPFTYYYSDSVSYVLHHTPSDGKFIESKIPLGKVPHAVSVEGYRKNWRVPLFSTARYAPYVQMKEGKEEPTAMWALRGEEQLAKCCEALMLRTVSPEECAGLFIAEEMGGSLAVRETDVSPTVVEKVTIPAPTVAPAVNQAKAPAEVTESVKPLESGSILTPGQGPYVTNNGPVAAPAVTENDIQAVIERNAAAQPDIIMGKETALPVPTLAPAVTVAPAQAPSGSLFTETNRPDPAHETTRFPSIVPPSNLEIPMPAGAAVPVSEVKPAVASDAPCTQKEYSDFINGRATKIIRDKLKSLLTSSQASDGVKNYLLKQSGKTVLKHISAADFERLLTNLEAGTPEETAELVKAQGK